MSSGSASTFAPDRAKAEDIATRVKGWRDGPELVPWLTLQIARIRASERVRVAAWLRVEARAWEWPKDQLIRVLANRIQRGEIE